MTEETPLPIPEIVHKWASLPPDEFERRQTALDVAAVTFLPYSIEGYLAFARIMLSEPDRFIEPARHHIEWIKACFDSNRVVILAPPESAKTTILSILFTAYTIGKKPWTQSIVVSVSDDQAEKIVGTIASYVEYHPGWRLCFPDIVPDKNRGWGIGGGFFVKVGADPSQYGEWLRVRGTRKDPTMLGVGYQNRAIFGKRVDGVLIVDDMMDENNTTSSAELEKAQSIFVKTISSRPTVDGKLILVGTPWKEDDVYANAVKTGLYRSFITPAARVDKSSGLLRDSYWPEVWPLNRLEDKRREFKDRAFRLMYLMDLDASKEQVLKTDWVSFIRDIEVDTKWPIFYGIDFAFTSVDFGLRARGSKRSYFAIAKIAAAPWGLVLVGGARGQFSLSEAIELVKAHAAVDGPRRIQVEAWGSGNLFIQALMNEGVAVFSYKDTKDKATRFSRLGIFFERGRVRVVQGEDKLPKGDFNKVFMDEWSNFPAGTNDCLDAVANAVDCAGFNLYAGDRTLKMESLMPPRGMPQVSNETPWGPWGIPKSIFQGGG